MLCSRHSTAGSNTDYTRPPPKWAQPGSRLDDHRLATASAAWPLYLPDDGLWRRVPLWLSLRASYVAMGPRRGCHVPSRPSSVCRYLSHLVLPRTSTTCSGACSVASKLEQATRGVERKGCQNGGWLYLYTNKYRGCVYTCTAMARRHALQQILSR